jgi:hypothetical protein
MLAAEDGIYFLLRQLERNGAIVDIARKRANVRIAGCRRA